MLKIKHKGFLVLGINQKEVKHLVEEKHPLHIKLDDLGLKGQVIVVVYGETNELLASMAEDIADRLEKVDIQNETGLILPDKIK